MTPYEFYLRTNRLEELIAFNKKIKCHLVAARYERQLEALKKEYNENN